MEIALWACHFYINLDGEADLRRHFPSGTPGVEAAGLLQVLLTHLQHGGVGVDE